MKKILFITTRNPHSGRFSGDVIGSLKIIKFLKKEYLVDVISLGSEKSNSNKKIIFFSGPNFFFKIIYIFISLIKLKPLQFGLFFSKKMKTHIQNNAKHYDLLFFYHIRSSQYLPKNYEGKTVLEMGDLYSSNYYQTFCNLSLFNPLKYIYLLESFFIKKVEKKIFTNFDKIILFSKSEIKKLDKSFSKKIVHINVSIDKIRKKYSFSKNNYKILFIGNLKYLPNIIAVKSFAKNIMPKLKEKISNIKFEVVGEISSYDKFYLSLNKDIKCWGLQKKLDKFINGSFCGLANLTIATGVQGKILSYMSYGLPVICSKKVAQNFNKNILSYSDEYELINKIKKLQTDKKLSTQISRKSLNFVKNLTWKKIGKQYLNIVKN